MSDSRLPEILTQHHEAILAAWRDEQAGRIRMDHLEDPEFASQSAAFLAAVGQASTNGQLEDISGPAWQPARQILEVISRSWATQGYTPSETATFVLSLKRALFRFIRDEYGEDDKGVADETWVITTVMDQLALYTTEAYLKSREGVIRRQQRELLELSTPVVQLWEGIVILPLIGTLDSARTQLVMESLLQMIVDTGSNIAIIDITGVGAVDTLVAQHLLKTVAAARLMGADCIISGISPQIAQTIVHLGVVLSDVTTKATLAGAFALALDRRGLTITRREKG